jgi:hypothetical protein
MYGLGPVAGLDGGGFMSEIVRVPYADAMLVTLPPGLDPVALASASDNVRDAWRCIGPYEPELAGARRVGSPGPRDGVGHRRPYVG